MLWKDEEAQPETTLIGRPHLSPSQVYSVSGRILDALAEAGKDTVSMRTVLSASPKVVARFKAEDPAAYARVISAGMSLSPWAARSAARAS
ncbi:hypothetical protein [Georgenia sp. AZ-5]|uniref:hypothetical protein n=1 Tax=Georgenia sp. AZ-5 TaxID=3367526 RepID=UPI003754C831